MLLTLGAGAGRGLPAATPDTLWTAHVQPLLKEHCARCHNAERQKSGLNLVSLETMLKGGDRGPAVVPGRPGDSPLYQFVLAGADPHMPPKDYQLTAVEQEFIRAWIEGLGTRPGTATSAATQPGGSPAAAPARVPVWVPPTNLPPSYVVDRFLELGWAERGVTPAAPADDRTFLRRLHLDLAGRPPTPAETEAFVRDSRPGAVKRAAWIDQLLAGPDHARHLREMFDLILLGRSAKAEGTRHKHGWYQFLEDSFRQNRPWDDLVRTLIEARPVRPGDRGAVQFLYERQNNHQAMAEATAPLVFGVQIQCAQCHDHMVAREIKQAHYWAMVTAFNRSKNVDLPGGPALGESAVGGFISFQNLKKESQPARLAFFNGSSVAEARPADGQAEKDSPTNYLVAPPPGKEPPRAASVPRFSRRAAMASVLTTNNPLLARAFVNRAWAMMFGRGLVHPVELMDSKHPPSHPDLLDWLAADFAAHGHDVRRLFRILANTRGYQLDSRPAPGPDGTPARRPAPESFAVALTKPLPAEILTRALRQVTGAAGDDDPVLRHALAAQFPAVFPVEYSASLQQALFLSNNPRLDALLAPQGDNLAARLLAVSDPVERVRRAFLEVYGREPDAAESAATVAYLAQRSPVDGIRQVLWALVAGAEFQLNH